MSEAVFPNHISAALDRLTVPHLPAGFGDRLSARIAANDLPAEQGAADVVLPYLRQPISVTGWRRSGRIVIVAAAFGLATATAAASGVFGDAVYVPVVSDVLARAELVEMPQKNPVPKPIIPPKIASENKAQVPVAQLKAGKDLVLARIAELRADPDYRNLTQQQRQERAKIEIGKLLTGGSVQKADVKAAWTQLALERQAAKQTRVAQRPPDRAKRLAEAKRPTPEQKAKVRDAVRQLTAEQRAELQTLRQRRRDATPQARRAVQAEIRAFWQRVGVEPVALDAASQAL
jgi:hypothetical protein